MVLFIHQSPFIIYLFLMPSNFDAILLKEKLLCMKHCQKKGVFDGRSFTVNLWLSCFFNNSKHRLKLFLTYGHVSVTGSQCMLQRKENFQYLGLWNTDCWYFGSYCMFGHMSCWALNLSAFITKIVLQDPSLSLPFPVPQSCNSHINALFKVQTCVCLFNLLSVFTPFLLW